MSVREMIPGRAFRFLYLVLCLWFASRVGVWLLAGLAVSSMTAAKPHVTGQPRLRTAATLPKASNQAPALQVLNHGKRRAQPFRIARPFLILRIRTSQQLAASMSYSQPREGIFDAPPDNSGIASLPTAETGSRLSDRWSLSAWLLYRPENGGARLANAGQLGASQAGARLAFDLTPAAAYALSLHGRVSAALDTPTQAEGAVGLSLRPSRAVPVAISVERRFNISDGGRDGFAAYVAGGVNPTPVFAGLEVEGYAQAGIVGASKRDAFADGRISLSRPLFGPEEKTQITAGFAVSGGAQPSLSRLDIGPQISARFPLGQSNARLTGEWRERVAGNARPSSGPAIILAADF